MDGRIGKGLWCCRFRSGVICGRLVEEGPTPPGKTAQDRPWTVESEWDGVVVRLTASRRRFRRPGQLDQTREPTDPRAAQEMDDDQGDT